MKILLDTHVFLWMISGDARLAANVTSQIRDPANDVYVSVVSIWEAVIKHSVGKLPLPQPPEVYLPLQRRKHKLASLDVDESSVCKLASLPPHHRDPFDRMLVSQAMAHGMAIATEDATIKAYPITVLWGSP